MLSRSFSRADFVQQIYFSSSCPQWELPSSRCLVFPGCKSDSESHLVDVFSQKFSVSPMSREISISGSCSYFVDKSAQWFISTINPSHPHKNKFISPFGGAWSSIVWYKILNFMFLQFAWCSGEKNKTLRRSTYKLMIANAQSPPKELDFIIFPISACNSFAFSRLLGVAVPLQREMITTRISVWSIDPRSKWVPLQIILD